MQIVEDIIVKIKKNSGFISAWSVIWIAVILVGCAVVGPVYQHAIRQNHRWTDLRCRLVSARRMIDRAPAITADNKRKAALVCQALAEGDGAISHAQLLSVLMAAARKSQISFVTIRPQTMRDRGDYYQLGFKMEIKSRFKQLRTFISLLDRSKFIIRPDDIAASGDKAGSPVLTTTIDAQCFFIKADLSAYGLEAPEFAATSIFWADTGNVCQPTNRDPFMPFGAAESAVALANGPAYQLKGVVEDPQKPLAIVMDGAGITYLLRRGDSMGSDRLIAIRQNSVALCRSDGTKYELKIW
jgi:hypothetical protein